MKKEKVNFMFVEILFHLTKIVRQILKYLSVKQPGTGNPSLQPGYGVNKERENQFSTWQICFAKILNRLWKSAFTYSFIMCV